MPKSSNFTDHDPTVQKRSLRIIFVSHTSQLNGADRSLLSLATELKQSGYAEPLVILPRVGPLSQYLHEEGVATITCPAVRWVSRRFSSVHAIASLSSNTFCLARCYRKLRRFNPDLIYSNTLATGFGVAIAFALRRPHILHIREFLQEDFRMQFDLGAGLSIRLIASVTKHIICNSRAVAAKFEPLFETIPKTVIYNGFECSNREHAHPDFRAGSSQQTPFRLFMAGTLSDGKNQADAIRALANLHRKGIDAHLYLAGKGNRRYTAYLKSLCVSLDITSSVHFLGFIDNLSSQYARADAVLICSRSEAFGRVAIEAMCFGAPVIAANNGGLAEIVEHNLTGLLYELNNVEALSIAVQRLVASPQLRQRLSVAAYKVVTEKFTIRQSKACMRSFYK
jgi:glycosyltransferase involved in cell wall biosynthesis